MTIEEIQLKDYYSNSDLSLTATISLWFPIHAIDRTNPHKAIFIFKRNKQLDELLVSYWRRELKVEPQAYFSQLKAVKARLYSER